MSTEPSLQRVFTNGRLAYYSKHADADHWDRVWESQDTKNLFADAKKGSLGYYEEIFPKHLPRQGRILEAGCGLGQFVIALRAKGFEAEGLDYAAKTIEQLNKLFPDIPFHVGDVTHLDVPNETYSGYISLGVMEHLEKGPKPFLVEAQRVLRQGGIACISVPYMNFLRRLKASLGVYRGNPNLQPFYQYAYSKSEFTKILKESGFDVLATYQYGGYKGVKDEIPVITKMFNWPQGWRLQKWLMNSKWLNSHSGHMMMYVAKRV